MVSKFFKHLSSTLIPSALLSALLISSVYAANEESCECESVKWKEAFDRAEHVVFGQVQNMQIHSDELATAKVNVMETFKGQASYIKKVAGKSKRGTSCLKVLRPGFYILYSFGSNNVVLNQCAASGQLNPKDSLVSVLSEIKTYAQLNNATSSQVMEAKPSVDEASNEQGSQIGADTQESKGDNEVDWLQSIIDWFG